MNYARSEPVSGQAAERLDSSDPQIALPRVSVIVTCFNYARYVGQALDSVAAQTYGNFDCVVVDDASTGQFRSAHRTMDRPEARPPLSLYAKSLKSRTDR